MLLSYTNSTVPQKYSLIGSQQLMATESNLSSKPNLFDPVNVRTCKSTNVSTITTITVVSCSQNGVYRFLIISPSWGAHFFKPQGNRKMMLQFTCGYQKPV